MKLKDLPQPIRELAEQRIREQGRDDYEPEESTLVASFTWFETEEGKDFWEEIYNGNFDVFYQLNPYESITKKIDQLNAADLAKVAEYVNEKMKGGSHGL